MTRDPRGRFARRDTWPAIRRRGQEVQAECREAMRLLEIAEHYGRTIGPAWGWVVLGAE